jgi:predicted nuclease of predicted toxin-antitoxin system
MAEHEPIRLFIDEDVWLGLAAALRERGFDAIHVYEVARGSLNDREQMAFAVQQQRAILTHNKRHYIPLVAEYYWADKVHYGILVIAQLPRGELLRRVEAFLRQHQANQVRNQVWFL